MKKSQKLKYDISLIEHDDYGYKGHLEYLSKLFGFTPQYDLTSDYKLMADNFGKPTPDTGATAVRYLYAYYVLEINKKLDDPSPENTFVFLSKLINGITSLQWNATVPDAEINAIKYNELFSVLSSMELRAIIGPSQTPSIKIINTRANNLIFQIRLKEQKTDNTNLRFAVLFEAGMVLESVLQSTEQV